jgi:sterol desaturase/sphingolipid hydroxylase (fatty acid hydroxylase superfamily)
VESPLIQSGARDASIRRYEGRNALSTLGIAVVLSLGTLALARAGALAASFALPAPELLAVEWGLFVFAFDFYFYGLHRLLHTRPLSRVHAVHHRSRAPGVLTALSFHPLEALLLLLYMPLVMLLFPIHLWSALLGGVVLAASIALAHCGREVFPRWWHDIPVLRWIATPLVHDTHHTDSRCNFSATTSIPDLLFGTYRLDAATAWAEMDARRGGERPAAADRSGSPSRRSAGGSDRPGIHSRDRGGSDAPGRGPARGITRS